MRVFVTGATGYIGTAVVQELLRAGHQVLGLARSDTSADALSAAGATAHRGALDDLDSLRAGARRADGVVHTAFVHDFSRFAESARTDALAVQALGSALAGSQRPLVIASGVAGVLAPGRVSSEEDAADTGAGPRAGTEQALLATAQDGVRPVAVRLPPTVHGEGDYGFVPMLAAAARERGRSAYIGDGANRWPAVHRLDAARVFRLAVERSAQDAGTPTRVHPVAEEGVAFRRIAEAIGEGLGIPTVSTTAEQAPEHFGFLAGVAGLDLPTASGATRAALGWEPTCPDLLADLAAGHYFRS